MMKIINGIMSKILVAFFLWVMVSVATMPQALAFDFVVKNTNSEKLYFAIETFIDQEDAWQVAGWWNVEPNSTKTFHFNHSNSKDDYFYIWGHAGKTTFDGTRDAAYRPVIDNKFAYWDAEGPGYFDVNNYNPPCPPGKNNRWVLFSRITIKDGKASWCPGGKGVVSSAGQTVLQQGMTGNISSQLGPKIVALALQLKGKPYVWGGASPETGFDCSGLTYYVLGQLGVNIERTADVQYHRQESINFKDLQPGDLVFFSWKDPDPEHVGIFIGNGQFIHAMNTQGAGLGATGLVTVSNFDRNHTSNFMGGRRFH